VGLARTLIAMGIALRAFTRCGIEMRLVDARDCHSFPFLLWLLASVPFYVLGVGGGETEAY